MTEEKKPQPNISITQNAKDSENVTQIGYQEGDVTIDNSQHSTVDQSTHKHTGDNIKIEGGVSGTIVGIGSGKTEVHGDVVGRDKIIGAPANASPEIEDLYTQLDARFNELIAAQQDDFQRQVVEQAVTKVQEEIKNGREAEENVNQVELYNAFSTVQQNSLGTDVIEVIDAIVTKGPAAGIVTVVQKVWGKVKEKFA